MIEQPITGSSPCEYISCESLRGSCSTSCRSCSTKGFLKPFKQALIRIINFKNAAIMFADVAIAFLFANLANPKATFAIYNSCHISKIYLIINLSHKIFRSFIIWATCFFHSILSKVNQYYYVIIHEAKPFVQAERLTPRDPLRICDSLISFERMRGEVEELCPPRSLGHKSNRLLERVCGTFGRVTSLIWRSINLL